MFEQAATAVLIVTGIIFGLVELVKPLYDVEKRENVGDLYAAALFGVVTCIAFKFDVFPIIGFPAAYPYVGFVLTGVLAGSAGGKALHDLLALARPSPIGPVPKEG